MLSVNPYVNPVSMFPLPGVGEGAFQSAPPPYEPPDAVSFREFAPADRLELSGYVPPERVPADGARLLWPEIGTGEAAVSKEPFAKEAKGTPGVESDEECSSCSGRKYVDISSDQAVSFQAPTKLNPKAAASAVASHERQHVFRERALAAKEGRTVLRQSVSIQYEVCPECGASHVAGGVTHTVSKAVSAYERGRETAQKPELPKARYA